MSTESWFWIPQVKLHTEEDGAGYISGRYGPTEKTMGWETAAADYPAAARSLLKELASYLPETHLKGLLHDLSAALGE